MNIPFIKPVIQRILFSQTAKNLLKQQGKRIVDYPAGEHKKVKDLLTLRKIDLVLDVGANEGQYALYLRSLGYKGAIISVEPLEGIFEKLQTKAAKDPCWKCVQLALGDKEETGIINVSENSQSSSLLQMKSFEYGQKSGMNYMKQQQVTVKTLDSIFSEITKGYNNIYLKLDVQGFERKVLEGARESLKTITGVQFEMALEELYEGEFLFTEMIEYLKERGFHLCAFKNGFHNEQTGKLYEADGIFYKMN
jgi:FkbM family methyltransferase